MQLSNKREILRIAFIMASLVGSVGITLFFTFLATEVAGHRISNNTAALLMVGGMAIYGWLVMRFVR